MTEIPTGAPGIPAAAGGPGSQPGPADEILVAFAEPADQRRLTVLVRVILAIPHMIVLWVLTIAAEVVALVCWFAALVTGRLPEGLADFQVGYLRWATRFYAYLFLLTDVYPPFEFADAEYPIRLRAQPGRLNRLAVLFRIILVIPAGIVSALVSYGLSFLVMFVTWLIVLIAGRMPRPLHEALAAAVRYQTRVSGYFLMLTARYPGGLFGDPDTAAFGMAPAGEGFPAGSAEPWAAGAPGAPGVPAGQPGYGQGGWGQGGWGQSEFGQPGPSAPAGGGAGYGAPAAYGQPEAGYGQPAPGYGQAGRGTASPGRVPLAIRPPGTASRPRRSAGSAVTSPGGWSCPARPSAWSPCSSCWACSLSWAQGSSPRSRPPASTAAFPGPKRRSRSRARSPR
jgi:Domain of unknown function (DUF4389)